MLKYFSRSLYMIKKLMLFMGVTVALTAGDLMSSDTTDTFWIWVAMFALGIVGIVILFFSSMRVQKMQKMHENVFKKQLEMEKNQAEILTTMSENIHSIAKEALKKSTEAIEKVSENSQIEKSAIVTVENKLLDVTNDLIEFLRLKSRKVEIVNEEFNLNNVLNEISGAVCSNFKGSSVELIFDIDNSVPRLLVGDSLHLGQILNNLLESRLSVLDNEELKLEISIYNTFEDKLELELQLIDNGAGMNQDEVDNLFMPYYDDENSQYVGLGLFVAHELVTMMNGELSIHSNLGKGTSFTLTLPFDTVDASNKRKYRLPEKILTDKKVLIVDSNFNSALAIKKMFAYFKHDVKVLSQEQFAESMPKLTPYDIVVLNEELLNIRTLGYLEEIKKEKEIKVVSLGSLLSAKAESNENDLVDRRMYKPLNQERIFEMIINMYELNVALGYKDEGYASRKAKIYKSTILETNDIKQSSFSIFKGRNLLIVEDNIINQKVLTNILNQSGMNITLANNGLEAVKLINHQGKSAFDLVLMDINMPVMDGYTATQKIRYEKKFDTLPIVAFTALVLDSEIEKMFNCGINAFLAKPLNIGKLYTALAMYLLDMPNKYTDKDVQLPVPTETLPGLIVAKGISHAANSEALYMEVLNEFSEAYAESDKVFEKLVHEHRYEQLKMLSLDMKGLSGTIGAKEMNEEVSEVQKLLLYKSYEQLPSHIDSYRTALKQLIKSIDLYLKG